jgi:hypothetical protein
MISPPLLGMLIILLKVTSVCALIDRTLNNSFLVVSCRALCPDRTLCVE